MVYTFSHDLRNWIDGEFCNRRTLKYIDGRRR